ncbi:MAG TPA: M13-type metalloendopeptidase [Acidimicrobiales bacterium]|nr:M13-type metalloendopeptidase [Acidimicrobiales bacterium]
MTTTLPSGFDPSELSTTVRAADDLYEYANRTWLGANPIPEDRHSWGSFELLRENSEENVHAILEEARGAEPGSEARKAADLYSSFLDEAAAETRGAATLAGPLAAVAACESVDDLAALVGSWQREGMPGLFHLSVATDDADPTRYRVYLEQGAISLPDESYYREDSFAEVRAKFVDHVERSLTLAGLDDGAARARRLMDLETKIAAGHWDKVASRDAVKTYNARTWPEVVSSVGDVADAWRTGLDAPAAALEDVVVRQPSFVETLGELLVKEDLAAWRDWLAFRVVTHRAPLMSSAFVDENFDFIGRTLTGQPQLRARWKRAAALANRSMGEAVARLYVERHFPPAAKARMDELVANRIAAYRQSIATLEWMGADTRARALEKLEKFTPKIGYPTTWRDYSALEVVPGDVIASARNAAVFEFNRDVAKIGAPVDRGEWFMYPQDVNAYYNPGFNEIVFPAAILQPPFFDPDRDDAANYGAIGAVIGHEIGHGFDDQGSRYDGDGRLHDWWEEADRAAFEVLTTKLIAQYDALSPIAAPDLKVNGALTIGENIGDLGGLGIAWKAYQISLGGAEAPVIDGLTGPQRFFLGWAASWRTQRRAEIARLLVASDPHAPDDVRCRQVPRNVDAFYDAFSVAPGDGEWLDPADRVTIW